MKKIYMSFILAFISVLASVKLSVLEIVLCGGQSNVESNIILSFYGAVVSLLAIIFINTGIERVFGLVTGCYFGWLVMSESEETLELLSTLGLTRLMPKSDNVIYGIIQLVLISLIILGTIYFLVKSTRNYVEMSFISAISTIGTLITVCFIAQLTVSLVGNSRVSTVNTVYTAEKVFVSMSATCFMVRTLSYFYEQTHYKTAHKLKKQSNQNSSDDYSADFFETASYEIVRPELNPAVVGKRTAALNRNKEAVREKSADVNVRKPSAASRMSNDNDFDAEADI